MGSAPGQPVELLEDVFMEPHAVHEHPKDHQSRQCNVHVVLLALALHPASAVGADIVAHLRACCRYNNFVLVSAHDTAEEEWGFRGGGGEGAGGGGGKVQP